MARVSLATSSKANTIEAFTPFHVMENIKSILPSLLSKLHRSYYHKSQNRTFTTEQTLKMPLVVPGINSGSDASKTDEWMNKLVGKKLGEGASNEVVC
jgi:hypothetical protein